MVVDDAPLLSQAPDWLDRTHVVWHEAVPPDEGGDGQIQVFASNLERSDARVDIFLAGPQLQRLAACLRRVAIRVDRLRLTRGAYERHPRSSGVARA